MKTNRLNLFVALITLAFAVAANAQTNFINGMPYVRTNPTESVNVPSSGLHTAESAYQYSGYVLVTGSGVWVYDAESISRNDLLYYFNNNNPEDVNLDPMFLGTAPITSANEAPIAPYDGNYPPYNLSHTYTIIVNIQASDPTNLYFGVGDSYYPDNSGSLQLQLTQLQPVASGPIFTEQPVSQVISPGQPVTFTAEAAGFPLPTYQWQFNGTNISGATSNSYTISPTTLTNIGYYTVVASNSISTNTSSAASLAFICVKMLAAVYVTGPVGANYQIDATPTVEPTNWTSLTNVIITSQPYIYVDYSTPTNSQQFYRAAPQ